MKKKALIPIVVIAAIAVIGGFAYKAHATDSKEHKIAVEKQDQAKAKAAEQTDAMKQEEKNIGNWSKDRYLGYVNPYESWFKPN